MRHITGDSPYRSDVHGILLHGRRGRLLSVLYHGRRRRTASRRAALHGIPGCERISTLRRICAGRLAAKPVLCLGGSLDIYTPPEQHCEPLRRAVERAGGTQFQACAGRPTIFCRITG
ncbi:MAG: hypothetical protein ACLR4Z_04055 [Butyricicoccaceae bacterium]